MRKSEYYLQFLNNAFCLVWRAIVLILPQPLPSLSTGLTLYWFFSWFQSKLFHRRYCIAAFQTVPWLGLCVRVSDRWTADLALLCSSFLHFLCFRVLIVLMSPNLGISPPEVQRTCSLLPVQVVWHNSYQSIFVLCCRLRHASSGALNCGKRPVCLSSHNHSIIILLGRDFQKLSVQILRSKQRGLSPIISWPVPLNIQIV